MKRFILVSLLCLVTIFGFATSDAMAIGLGVYFNGGSGSADWTVEFDDYDNSLNFEPDTSHAGFGFVLDTAVAKDSLFNYRLNLGYEKSDYEFNGGSKIEMDGFVWGNTFGFGVLRTRNVRLWLGPQLEFSGRSGKPEGFNEPDMTLFGVGIGPVIGVNINLGKVVTLAFDGGYKFRKYFGWGEYSSGYSGYYYSDETYDVSEGLPFLNFSIIFRIGDIYE